MQLQERNTSTESMCLDETAGALEVLAHPLVMAERLRLTEAAGRADTEAYMEGTAPAAPASHVSPLSCMKSMLSRHLEYT